MANPKHLAKLKEGVEAWNRWREENPRVVPNLTGADLAGAKLSGAKLSWADLSSADLEHAVLSRANLREADLSRAELSWAHLGGAWLIGANLRWANLIEANLYKAKLSTADLVGARLGKANLVEADFSGARFASTFFGDTRLKGAIGLDSCLHDGPSYLDYFTLKLSWPLPLAFLRGCGLPDQYIDYLPSLLKQAIDYYSCFISHSTKDKQFAERLYGDLQNKNVRCWYAPEDLKIGDPFQERIERSIHLQDKFLLILSENSVESSWVEDEVQSALERERVESRLILFPIRIDDAVMETPRAWAAKLRRTRHIGDFCHWKDHDSYKQAFDSLLRDLKAQSASDSASSGE